LSIIGKTPPLRHCSKETTMARFAPHASVNASRYMIVPCEADGCGDLAVIWDRLEEQVVDVISAAASARYSDEDAMWDEARSFTDAPADTLLWRMAA
jgi:hypothetical protein